MFEKFISELESELIKHNIANRENIIESYTNKFNELISQKVSPFDIIVLFGDPSDIAKSFIDPNFNSTAEQSLKNNYLLGKINKENRGLELSIDGGNGRSFTNYEYAYDEVSNGSKKILDKNIANRNVSNYKSFISELEIEIAEIEEKIKLLLAEIEKRKSKRKLSEKPITDNDIEIAKQLESELAEKQNKLLNYYKSEGSFVNSEKNAAQKERNPKNTAQEILNKNTEDKKSADKVAESNSAEENVEISEEKTNIYTHFENAKIESKKELSDSQGSEISNIENKNEEVNSLDSSEDSSGSIKDSNALDEMSYMKVFEDNEEDKTVATNIISDKEIEKPLQEENDPSTEGAEKISENPIEENNEEEEINILSTKISTANQVLEGEKEKIDGDSGKVSKDDQTETEEENTSNDLINEEEQSDNQITLAENSSNEDNEKLKNNTEIEEEYKNPEKEEDVSIENSDDVASKIFKGIKESVVTSNPAVFDKIDDDNVYADVAVSNISAEESGTAKEQASDEITEEQLIEELESKRINNGSNIAASTEYSDNEKENIKSESAIAKKIEEEKNSVSFDKVNKGGRSSKTKGKSSKKTNGLLFGKINTRELNMSVTEAEDLVRIIGSDMKNGASEENFDKQSDKKSEVISISSVNTDERTVCTSESGNYSTNSSGNVIAGNFIKLNKSLGKYILYEEALLKKPTEGRIIKKSNLFASIAFLLFNSVVAVIVNLLTIFGGIYVVISSSSYIFSSLGKIASDANRVNLAIIMLILGLIIIAVLCICDKYILNWIIKEIKECYELSRLSTIDKNKLKKAVSPYDIIKIPYGIISEEGLIKYNNNKKTKLLKLNALSENILISTEDKSKTSVTGKKDDDGGLKETYDADGKNAPSEDNSQTDENRQNAEYMSDNVGYLSDALDNGEGVSGQYNYSDSNDERMENTAEYEGEKNSLNDDNPDREHLESANIDETALSTDTENSESQGTHEIADVQNNENRMEKIQDEKTEQVDIDYRAIKKMKKKKDKRKGEEKENLAQKDVNTDFENKFEESLNRRIASTTFKEEDIEDEADINITEENSTFENQNSQGEMKDIPITEEETMSKEESETGDKAKTSDKGGNDDSGLTDIKDWLY